MRLFFCLVICSIFLSCYAQDDNRVRYLSEISNEEIMPIDSVWSVFEKQPEDSVTSQKQSALQSLGDYIQDYYIHNMKSMVKVPELKHFKFYFDCYFDRYGNIIEVKGRYGKGNDSFEDAAIDYLMKMPRYEKWEDLSGIFPYKIVPFRLVVVI